MLTAVRPVAYLVNQYPKVSHSFIRREIQALERRGVDVVRFAMRGWDASLVDPADEGERARTRYLLKDGVLALIPSTVRSLLASPRQFVHALRLAYRSGHRADRPLVYHLIYLAQACRLVGWLREVGARHVHAHFGTNAAEVAMLVYALGGPSYSFTVHGPEEFDKPEFLGLGKKIAGAAFVVAISSYGRSQLYRWAGIADWPKVHVVHCGLEHAFHEGAGGPPPAAPRLVCVGRLCEQKGQLLLLEALHLLQARAIEFELVLGGDGEMRDDIERAIDRLGLRARVRITGWISSAQVRQEVLAARALVLASFAEGLPVVVMEAMALGRPVVTTFVAGLPELVQDRVTGWLVPAGDVAALAVAIEACLAAPPSAIDAMGQRARRRAVERHDIDVAAERLAFLFDRASERSADASRA